MLSMEDPRSNKRNHARWDIDRVRYHLDKPSAPNREIRRIDDILKDVVEGLEAPQDETLLVLRDAWPGLVGQQIAKHSQPASLEYHALNVSVDHPGWVPELERLKRVLMQKLQARYPDLQIRKLNFVLLHR